jgi:transcriptional regulator with XRE-family HTH domain
MLGSHLIAWRTSRSLSQSDVAAKAKLPRPYLSKLERNAADPSLSVLRRLASALGLSVGELVDTKPPVKALDRFDLEKLARELFLRDRKHRLGERAVRHMRAQVGDEQWAALLSRLQKHRWQKIHPLP